MTNMERLCDRESPQGSPIHSPFWVELDGQRYACATNGHVIVARVGGTDGLRPAPERPAKSVPVVDTLKPKPDAVAIAVDVAKLWAYCGEPEWPLTCESCNGSGEGTCPTCYTLNAAGQCDGCEGTGEYTPGDGPRPALIGSVGFDRRLVARGLSALGVQAGKATLHVAGTLDGIVLISAEWRMTFMPWSDTAGLVPVPADVVAWPT